MFFFVCLFVVFVVLLFFFWGGGLYILCSLVVFCKGGSDLIAFFYTLQLGFFFLLVPYLNHQIIPFDLLSILH